MYSFNGVVAVIFLLLNFVAGQSQANVETDVDSKRTSETPTRWHRLIGEVSYQKCGEYSRITENGCPFNRQKRVAGGEPASRTEFPHMVQIGFDSKNGIKWACGGSLISDEYVLTAAQCLFAQSLGKPTYARMGIVDLENDDHLQQFNISEVIPHPLYQQKLHYNDIGLVRLDKRVKFTTWVRPACLYTSNNSPWTNVIVSGWGSTDVPEKKNTVLQKAILELYDQPTCNKIYSQLHYKEEIKAETMICAGHSTELKDTCSGDAGGPIQVYRYGEMEKCIYEVVGITSFGVSICATAVNTPSVFTRVSAYAKWIEDIVWPSGKWLESVRDVI